MGGLGLTANFEKIHEVDFASRSKSHSNLEDLTTLKLDQSNGWGKLRSVDRKGMFAVNMG